LAVATGAVAAIRRIPVSPPTEPVSLASLFAGVGFIWRKRTVLGAISLDLFAVLLGGATALLPIYAKDILLTGPWGLGLLRAAPAVGALVIGIVLAHTPLARHVGRRMFVAVAIYGMATVVFGLSRDFTLSMIALAVSGAADMVSVVIRQTLVQLDTPDAMRGRVSAVNGTFIGASNELGEFRAGKDIGAARQIRLMAGEQHAIRTRHQIRLDHVRALRQGQRVAFHRMFGAKSAGTAMGNHDRRGLIEGLPVHRFVSNRLSLGQLSSQRVQLRRVGLGPPFWSCIFDMHSERRTVGQGPPYAALREPTIFSW